MEDREQVHTRVPRRPVQDRARSRFQGVDLDERLRSGPPVPRTRRSRWARNPVLRDVRDRRGGRA